MMIENMNWFAVEDYLKNDNTAILSLGSTEQHGYLSLATDHILASKIAKSCGEQTKVPVFPGLPFGIAPYFSSYPGSITISPQTYFSFVLDILESLYRQGFRKFFIVNGHGGNSPIQAAINHWLISHEDATYILHNWWATKKVMGQVKEISSIASHASWMENFPWTRIEGVVSPTEQKPMVCIEKISRVSPSLAKELIGDGNYGGFYQLDDKDMDKIWKIAIDEAVELVNDLKSNCFDK